MPFSNLVGNELAKTALARMVDQKSVPSTLLFYGPEGVGKKRFALGLAELLMGEGSAYKLATGTHPDLHFFSPEGKSGMHPVENIRKLIDEVALPPLEAPAKVFVLDAADRMLPPCSNALLKTLEEPPPHSYFILLAGAPDALLPTIVSRCRKVPFLPIPQPQIEALILEKWGKTKEEARRIAFLSHGSLARAEQLAHHRGLPCRAQLLEMLALRAPSDYPQCLKLASAIEESCLSAVEEAGTSSLQDHADLLFEEIIAWYRDLHLLKQRISPEFVYHLDQMELLKAALACPFPSLERIMEGISKARLAVQRTVRLRAVLEHFFLESVAL